MAIGRYLAALCALVLALGVLEGCGTACRMTGQSCAATNECCSGSCVAGTCVGPGGSSCSTQFQPCTTNASCCGSGTCTAGVCGAGSCQAAGQGCANNGQCCNNNCNTTTGRCM